MPLHIEQRLLHFLLGSRERAECFERVIKQCGSPFRLNGEFAGILFEIFLCRLQFSESQLQFIHMQNPLLMR